MKKKKIIYLMLPIVLLVWGVVFYQLFSYFFSSPTYVTEKEEITVNIDEIKKDTFSIIANYRDPFLGKQINTYRSNSTNNNHTTTNKKKKTRKEKPTENPWPSIRYKGMIKNNNSEKRVGIVGINGKEHLVKEGDILSGIKFTVIQKELINVRFQNEQKTISK